MKRKKYLWNHPSGRVYFRRGKLLVRMLALEGTAEFDAQYWEIMTGKRAEAKRSWAALIEVVRNSDEWADLSPRYRKDLDPVFGYLIEKMGNRDVARLTQADIYDAMEANRHRVRFANYIATAVSMLSKVAVKKRWRLDNPAIGVSPKAMPKAKRKPHVPWPDWAVAKFRAEASETARLIFEMGVGTVQRPGDWPDFTWGDYDAAGDGLLRLRQNKTDKPLELPCTVELKRALEQAKAGLSYAPLPSRSILCTPSGGKMGYRYIAELLLKERKRLGLQAFDQHALRYRGVMELAWAGCTDDEIASYSGHTSLAMIRKYAGEARQIMRARQARIKRQ